MTVGAHTETMRFRFPRLRRGGTMPANPGDSDSVMVRLSPGRHAEPIPGGLRCTTCGDVHVTQDDLPHAKAGNWLVQHHCEPRGPIEEIGD